MPWTKNIWILVFVFILLLCKRHISYDLLIFVALIVMSVSLVLFKKKKTRQDLNKVKFKGVWIPCGCVKPLK